MTLLWAPIERVVESRIKKGGWIEREEEFHGIRVRASGDKINHIESILHDMEMLNSKSAALLQFISIILGSLTLSYSIVDSKFVFATYIQIVLLIYMSVFAFAAWIALRCLNIMGPPVMMDFDDGEGYKRALSIELAKRRSIYFLSLRITIYVFALLLPFALLCLSLRSWG